MPNYKVKGEVLQVGSFTLSGTITEEKRNEVLKYFPHAELFFEEEKEDKPEKKEPEKKETKPKEEK